MISISGLTSPAVLHLILWIYHNKEFDFTGVRSSTILHIGLEKESALCSWDGGGWTDPEPYYTLSATVPFPETTAVI